MTLGSRGWFVSSRDSRWETAAAEKEEIPQEIVSY